MYIKVSLPFLSINCRPHPQIRPKGCCHLQNQCQRYFTAVDSVLSNLEYNLYRTGYPWQMHYDRKIECLEVENACTHLDGIPSIS
jgi:hypothetical protein